jgi:Flp pilus assembly protein TadG
MRLAPLPTIRRRFAHDAGGAAAVEFAFVVMPFVLLLAAIIQIALTGWASQNLDEALERAVRKIYTGAFQGANKAAATQVARLDALKVEICGKQDARIARVFNCENLNVKLDVAVSASFAASARPTIVDPNTGTWVNGFGTRYQCAAPGAIVVVTVAVRQPVAFPFLNYGAAVFSDGARLLQSTAVFRTEPYDSSSGGSC